MSSQLLSHSEDLERLRSEGYELAFRAGMLLVGVPYLTAQGEIARGYLVSTLSSSDGERTQNPVDDHTVGFLGATGSMGDKPYDSDGRLMDYIMAEPNGPVAFGTIEASCRFSQKKPNDVKYVDYYEKMTTNAEILLAEVHVVDPEVRIQNDAPIATDDEYSVHNYFDSATSRSRIGAVSDKTRDQKIAIIGLGGTGSYILDAVSKTHVREIHLYDADELHAHNAFRAPGAVSIDALRDKPLKVEHHAQVFGALHRHITPHPVHIDSENIAELRQMDFVFVSIDSGPAKRLIFEKLIEFGVPFVDTGMGADQSGSSLGAIIRTTRILPGVVDQAWIDENIDFTSIEDDEYDQNIQIAELNMLNAAHAVISWKKHIGFYRDFRQDIESEYTLDGNMITRPETNEDD